MWEDELTIASAIDDTASMLYDENGNPINYWGLDVRWSAGRQLSKIVGLDDNGNEEAYASFSYDENGIRTAERNTEEGLTWDFATEDGVITGRHSDDGKNDQFLYDDSGKPTAMLHNGRLYYYITNQMGDVVGITDSDGNLAVENFYDAWGDNYTSAIEECDFDGKTGWNGAYKLYNSNPMRYRGYYYDVGIGMYYLQSRYFNPTVNRFFNADDPDIARESKDLAVGMNLFAYCNNDPVNNVDPTGFISKINAAVCLVVFCVYFVAPYLLNDKRQKYNFAASKVYIDPTGLCIAKIKYYKSKLVKKSFQVVLGEKRDWGNKKNIENNMNMTAISYNSNQINSLMSKAGTSNFTKDDAIRVTVSTFLNVCYLIKGGVSTAKIKYNYAKIWGKYIGIYANSKVNVILARIIKGGDLNGWYHFF